MLGMKCLLRKLIFSLPLLPIAFMGCKNTKKAEEKPVEAVIIATQPSEIDFIASGKNWNLEIDFVKKATLLYKNDTSEIETINYQFNNGTTVNTDIHLTIINDGCSDESFYSVEIIKEGKKLTGCGYFTNKAYELIGKWSPDNADNQVIDFMSLVKIKGNDGCNRFFGHYSSSGSQIDFQAISRTRKACPSDIKYLDQVTDGFVEYEVKTDTLWLKSETTKAVLVRVK